MKNRIGAQNVRWDLSFLYSGPNDPQINVDVSRLVEMAKNFNATYKGKLSKKLGEAITDLAEVDMLEKKVYIYLFLQQSLNVGDAIANAKVAEVEKILSAAFGEYLTFFDIELVALDESVLEKMYASNAVVAKYRPWIEHRRIFKPHLLSEPVESALAKRSPFGASAWSDFFDELEADLEFEFNGEKKTLTEMLHLLTDSKDADERSRLMSLINSGLGGVFAKYSAQTLYMVAGSGSVEVFERNYKHPMESRNKSNRVSEAVVDALHRAVKNVASPLTKRYYRLKAAHLGLDKLRWSDRNAPMPFADAAIVSFDEALKTVLAAYESFSPTLAKLIRGMVEQKRIDAPVMKGKRSGAFNYSFILPGNVPVSFVFLNYLGSARDVMTLAHEAGHGVHGLLAGSAQGTLMASAPMAYAETASIFGEMTTFNFLKERLIKEGDKESLLVLLMSTIDDIINTVVRQIGFSNFERRIHGMNSIYTKWESPNKYSVEELNGIWLETLKELYGEDGEVFTYENTEHLWTYIPHFHRPFYVYSYAFGQLLSQSLYAQQPRIGERFESLYLDLLRAGSTKDVVELLAPFGLDPTSESFWIDGIKNGLGALIEEAEQLSREMGIH